MKNTQSFSIRPFTLRSYAAVLRLWKRSAGVAVSEADSRRNIAAYLRRNPGMSFIAIRRGAVVGAVLCGHDGRRGLLHHLAVDSSCRRLGIGRALVERGLNALRAQGIEKCHLFVIRSNIDGYRFWRRVGWNERKDVRLMSRDLTGGATASCRC